MSHDKFSMKIFHSNYRKKEGFDYIPLVYFWLTPTYYFYNSASRTDENRDIIFHQLHMPHRCSKHLLFFKKYTLCFIMISIIIMMYFFNFFSCLYKEGSKTVIYISILPIIVLHSSWRMARSIFIIIAILAATSSIFIHGISACKFLHTP